MIDRYECEGQTDIFDFLNPDPVAMDPDPAAGQTDPPQCFADYIGRCEYCYWGNDPESCTWSDRYQGRLRNKAFQCINRSNWMPCIYKIPKLCGNCEHSNPFRYQVKDKYKPMLKNGYYHDAACDPVEEPNIYCTYEDGSLNRSQPFAKFCHDGFGIGSWDRQHEFDTCDNWELDRHAYNYRFNANDYK